MKQINLIKKTKLEYGGELLKTRAGRAHGRPIDTKHTTHLVLRSSKAKGEYSFKKPHHAKKIKAIVGRFSEKYGIQICDEANVGNHLHFQIKIRNREAYKRFIRAITSAIAMAVSGVSRWCKSKLGKFWDYRPYTRVVIGRRDFLGVRNYIDLNRWEAMGYTKTQARFLKASERRYKDPRLNFTFKI